MFAAFLSEDMTYSCAIFDELDADIEDQVGKGERKDIHLAKWSKGGKKDNILPSPTVPDVLANPAPRVSMTTDALYYAEMRKLQHIIRKADIQKGHRVLEIGTGTSSPSLSSPV